MMKQVLLSFDIEEFDMPMEYGKPLPFDEQIRVSSEGTKIILDILLENKINATFFSTVIFASNATDLIGRIIKEGHELGSHSYYHSEFKPEHLAQSKLEIERISGHTVKGFRMPRMMPTDAHEIFMAGYQYNSSLNPIYLPGRYNNFFKPRTLFKSKGIFEVPASATPIVRFPLFWLSFHNLPLWAYQVACARTINHDKYVNIYFHPWEFTDLTLPKYGFPKFVSKNSGSKMTDRFRALIDWMKRQGYSFSTIGKFVEKKTLWHRGQPSTPPPRQSL